MLDMIIVGGGAAGLSAAVTAKARNKKVLVISNSIDTSSLHKAERVDNYLGFYGITGQAMLARFSEHAENMGVSVSRGKVQQIMSMGDYFAVNEGDNFYETKTIILATGIKRGGNIKGEHEFLGKGLSYCATCDGMLYKNKTVVISGDSAEVIHDVQFLREICEKVILVSRNEPDITSSEKLAIKKGKITEIEGDAKVKSVIVDGEKINCDGVFLINESIPADSLVYGLEMQDGVIVTDKNMNTNVSGVFAAGDCTGAPFQISKAVGEGLIAALSASLL